MRLCEHPDFGQVILRAEEHFGARGLRAAIIEKDYYVTAALRAINDVAGSKVIFKGGTSLSKGWNLIARFSEDIDLFLDPRAFTPPLGSKGIDRELKRLRDCVDAHPGLQFLPAESQTIGGFGRADRFSYTRQFGGVGDVANRVLLEAGTASGTEPTEDVALESFAAQFLRETGLSLGAADEGSFVMRLLHFRRTFVEKLFAIHAKVAILQRDGRALGGYARHYYDLYCLAGTPDVPAMLKSREYASIKADYDHISREHFARDYIPPRGMSFADSEALFPLPALASQLEAEYERQCRQLCYGAYPSWSDVQRRFAGLRGLL